MLLVCGCLFLIMTALMLAGYSGYLVGRWISWRAEIGLAPDRSARSASPSAHQVTAEKYKGAAD